MSPAAKRLLKTMAGAVISMALNMGFEKTAHSVMDALRDFSAEQGDEPR